MTSEDIGQSQRTPTYVNKILLWRTPRALLSLFKLSRNNAQRKEKSKFCDTNTENDAFFRKVKIIFESRFYIIFLGGNDFFNTSLHNVFGSNLYQTTWLLKNLYSKSKCYFSFHEIFWFESTNMCVDFARYQYER